MASQTNIYDFYQGKNILVTGATGLLGIVLVEKLLRSFPCVEKIYVIVREHNGQSLEDRRERFFQETIFCKITCEDRDKVVFVEGQLGEPQLGMSSDDIQMIQNNVDLVFHCAALVNLKARLDKAVKVNVIGTAELLNIFKDSARLKCFMHVSSVYSNVDATTSVCEEKIYPLKYPVEELIYLANKNPEDVDKEKMALGKYPNTYILTKNFSEHVVCRREGRWPAGIFRAANLTPTYAEPVRYYGAVMGLTQLLIQLSSGFQFEIYDELNINATPIDMCASCLLATARDTVENYNNEVRIYNYCNSAHPCKFGDAIKYYIGNTDVNSIEKTKVQQYLHDEFESTTKVFLNKIYDFPGSNVEDILKKLCEDDKKLLRFDLDMVDWETYFGKMQQLFIKKLI